MTSSTRRSVFLTIALTLMAHTAAAQTIRVVAPELAVRSRPDLNAPSIAVVAAGTILEVTARQDGWYEVRVPGTGPSAGQRGFVAAGLVEAIAAGPSTSTPGTQIQHNSPGLLGGPNALPAPSADWQARHERALGGRRSGITKVRIGTPIALAGVATLIYGSYVKGLFAGLQEDQPSTSEYWTYMGVGAAIAIPGAILMVQGRRQMNAASRELLILEDERLRAQTSAVLKSSWGSDSLWAEVWVGPGAAAAHVGVGW